MHKTQDKTAKRVLTPKPRRPGDKVGVGAASMRDATVRMKKVAGVQGVLAGLGAEGAKTKEEILDKLTETDYTHNRRETATVPLLIEKHAIAEIAGGASPHAVAVKYDLSAGYVQHALRRRYGSPEAAKIALQGLCLEGAMACMVKGLIEIPNMSGPQAVMSGAILVDKSLALEKSIADRPKTINFEALADMGKTLKVIREIASAPRQD